MAVRPTQMQDRGAGRAAVRGPWWRPVCSVVALAALASVVGALAPVLAGAQQGPPVDDRRYDEDLLRREREFSNRLMSPFCPGRTMVNCPSPNAQAYRETFKRYLAEGVSEERIREQFESQFGEFVRSTPKSRTPWVLLGAILLVGGGALVYALIRFSKPASTDAAEQVRVPRELEEELDRELRSRGL